MPQDMRGLTQCECSAHAGWLQQQATELTLGRGHPTDIADLRACKVRELEEKRVNKEMAHIRQKFKGATGLSWPSVQGSTRLGSALLTRVPPRLDRGEPGWLSTQEVPQQDRLHVHPGIRG